MCFDAAAVIFCVRGKIPGQFCHRSDTPQKQRPNPSQRSQAQAQAKMPRFNVDLDGTLRNILQQIVDLYHTTYPNSEPVNVDDIRQYQLATYFPALTEEFTHWAFAANAKHVFLEAQPYPGALEFVHALQQRGTVCYVTSQRRENWQLTRDWLERWELRGEVVFTSDKLAVPGDVLIDDAPVFLVAADPRCVCIARPYNGTYEGTRLDGYDAILQWIDAHKFT